MNGSETTTKTILMSMMAVPVAPEVLRYQKLVVNENENKV